ncbi:MAG: InlB B-repeat-containing protein, partial [Candidatus Methanomethylophilaceae archaeon]|nr:InlB B-repeat-containing protein [Candidatus Methanomethylophilaceae archaeon]
DEVPELEGMVFVGWNNTGQANRWTYGPGDLCYVPSDAKMMAVWREPMELKVAFTDGGSVVAEVAVTEGERVVVVDDVPSRPGMRFLGWNATGDVSEDTYNAGDEMDVPEDLTVRAVWETMGSIYVTFRDGDRVVFESKVLSGYPLTVPTTVPKSEGMNFAGWAAPGGSVYMPGDSIPVTSDTVLEAVWEETGEVSVVFMDMGSVSMKEYVAKGTEYTVTDSPAHVEGYESSGCAPPQAPFSPQVTASQSNPTRIW